MCLRADLSGLASGGGADEVAKRVWMGVGEGALDIPWCLPGYGEPLPLILPTEKEGEIKKKQKTKSKLKAFVFSRSPVCFSNARPGNIFTASLLSLITCLGLTM